MSEKAGAAAPAFLLITIAADNRSFRMHPQNCR